MQFDKKERKELGRGKTSGIRFYLENPRNLLKNLKELSEVAGTISMQISVVFTRHRRVHTLIPFR